MRIIVERTKFVGCLDSSDDHYGAAIYVNKTDIQFNYCLFTLCMSTNAGAIYSTHSRVSFVETNLTQNMAILQGGAGILVESMVLIRGGMTKLNEGQNTGAFIFSQSRLILKRHAFLSNTAHFSGSGAISLSHSQINIRECSFVHNEAEEDGISGAIAINNMPNFRNVIEKCSFITNKVNNKETCILVRGNESVCLFITDCSFDTPVKGAILCDGSPRIVMSGLIFDLQVADMWHTEADNSGDVAWKSTITHDTSNRFAVAMIITAPLFIALCFYILP